MVTIHPAFDWLEIARLAMTSRLIDQMEEQELVPAGLVTYQFSASGHELGQLLISQLLTYPYDAADCYYRNRPFMLGSGMTVEEAFASDMSRIHSINGGRDVGVVTNMPRRKRALILAGAADVGSQFTPTAGFAQGICYRVRELGEQDKAGSIAVAFGGEGSVASNGFWSSLTMATTLSLPMLFVIEDNGYAISVKGSLQTPGNNIAANLASFANLKIWDGSGTQPAETADMVYAAVNYVRAGHGPALLRLTVPRLSGHSSVDNQAYKSDEVRASERARDPIPALHDYLVPALLDEAAWQALVEAVQQTTRAAAAAAQAQPFPDPATVGEFVFARPGHPQLVGGLAAEGITLPGGTDVPAPDSPQRINFIEAVRRTLDVELSVNPRCVVFGEDVGEKGGVHAATVGLQTKHGGGRVFDTSLNEEGIIGRSVGLAYAGLVPVPEIQFRKYADPATEQLNNCGTIRWRTVNRYAAPIVVRMPGGYRRVGDPWHSVTSEVVFAHAVGWKLAFPSNAEDVVGLLRTALRGNDPVIFFEHRAMLDAAWARRPYPGDDYMLPFGRAKFIQTGTDLTVVTWGAMVERCEAAAREAGASVDLLDLRTLVPWDKTAILESVKKTGKCLIVHEDIGVAGFGAEIAATIAQDSFMDLDAPLQRITAPLVPMPFNSGLMEAVVPKTMEIKQAIEHLIAY